jgi:hypothetical protein
VGRLICRRQMMIISDQNSDRVCIGIDDVTMSKRSRVTFDRLAAA